MKIFIVGATGGVGKHVVEQALQAGHEITAYVRDISKLDIKHERLQLVSGDGLDEQQIINAMAGHDAVICTVGSKGLQASTLQETVTKHLIKGMKQHNIDKIVYCASAGIHKELKGLSGKFVMYLLRHALADHAKAYEVMKSSGVNFVVVRPMGLKDEDQSQYREFPHMEPPQKSVISRKAVANFIVKAVNTDIYDKKSIGLSY